MYISFPTSPAIAQKVIPELIIPLTAFIFDSNLIKAFTYPGGFAIHDNEA